eukprot:1229931-Pleurochrysis_carterae.AAC.1
MPDNTPSANLVFECNMNFVPQRREASTQYEAKVRSSGGAGVAARRRALTLLGVVAGSLKVTALGSHLA